MTLPTTEQIINMYLYGQPTTPTVIVVRPSEATTTITINSEEYMQTVGRFATGDQLNIVQNFFDSSTILYQDRNGNSTSFR